MKAIIAIPLYVAAFGCAVVMLVAAAGLALCDAIIDGLKTKAAQ